MSRFYKNIQVSTEWMVYPNPYFFFRPPEKSDLLAIACWMSAAGRPREEEEWRVLRQLKRYYGYPMRTTGPDPGHRPEAAPGHGATPNSWIAVVAGAPAFLLECTVTGEVYLTGRPAIHASPWKALEAWGYSIPWLFSQQVSQQVAQQGLSRLWMPLPDTRVAEIRALRRLGCRREQLGAEVEEGVEVWTKYRLFPVVDQG